MSASERQRRWRAKKRSQRTPTTQLQWRASKRRRSSWLCHRAKFRTVDGREAEFIVEENEKTERVRLLCTWSGDEFDPPEVIAGACESVKAAQAFAQGYVRYLDDVVIPEGLKALRFFNSDEWRNLLTRSSSRGNFSGDA